MWPCNYMWNELQNKYLWHDFNIYETYQILIRIKMYQISIRSYTYIISRIENDRLKYMYEFAYCPAPIISPQVENPYYNTLLARFA